MEDSTSYDIVNAKVCEDGWTDVCYPFTHRVG